MKEYNEQVVETLDDAGCIIANKNIIIDNLQARIAELEGDVAIERASRKYWEDAYSEWINTDKAAQGLIAKDERIAELEEENARLKAECDDIKQVQFPRKLKAVAVGWKKQLAAEQLNNKLLRDALNQWIGIAANCSIESGWCCCGDSIENHSHPMACGHSPVDMADSVVREAIDSTGKALSLTASTEALDKYVAEKVKEAMK